MENKQIIIVSDGEPTAHIENGRPVFFYPPLPETFHKTLLEVKTESHARTSSSTRSCSNRITISCSS